MVTNDRGEVPRRGEGGGHERMGRQREVRGEGEGGRRRKKKVEGRRNGWEEKEGSVNVRVGKKKRKYN